MEDGNQYVCVWDKKKSAKAFWLYHDRKKIAIVICWDMITHRVWNFFGIKMEGIALNSTRTMEWAQLVEWNQHKSQGVQRIPHGTFSNEPRNKIFLCMQSRSLQQKVFHPLSHKPWWWYGRVCSVLSSPEELHIRRCNYTNLSSLRHKRRASLGEMNGKLVLQVSSISKMK